MADEILLDWKKGKLTEKNKFHSALHQIVEKDIPFITKIIDVFFVSDAIEKCQYICIAIILTTIYR